MKIGITGAAGFIGQNAAEYFASKGHQVVGFDQRASAALSDTDMTIGNLADFGQVLRWFESTKFDVLLHLGARTDLLGKTLADYQANTIGVENIVRAANASPTVSRVLFASSRMVCSIDHVPSDYMDYCPPNAYGLSKVEGEQIVRKSKCRFSWSIFRPTSIWGPKFGVPYRNFFNQVRARRFVHVRGHNPAKSFGYIGNSVFQLEKMLLASDEQINTRFFYMGDYEPLYLRPWADLINEEFGCEHPIREVGYHTLKCAALLGDILRATSGRELFPITSFRLRNMIQNMVYPQLEELAEVTGSLPYDYRQGTHVTVNWVKRN